MKELMRNKFRQLDPVLMISCVLAVVSMVWNPPTKEYLEFIDVRVICLLFALMAVVAGFGEEGIFAELAEKLVRKAGNLRTLAYTMIGLCFFSSMFITNDVALITFVPMTILMISGSEPKYMIRMIVLETIASNVGSMLLPLGNPQSLYIYGRYQMQLTEFMAIMLPFWVASLIITILLIRCLFPKEVVGTSSFENGTSICPKNGKKIVIYVILFIIAVCGVVRLIPYGVVTGIVILVLLFMEPRILKKVDYGLLFTFLFFFIFVGNLSRIEVVQDVIRQVLQGHETVATVLVSQVISNVPAALMLSGFTQAGEELLIGVNIGSLGTLIASMASLISYKFYRRVENNSAKKYLTCFTGWNLFVLIILVGLYFGTTMCFG